MNRNFNKIYQEIYTNGLKEINAIKKNKNINLVILIMFFVIFVLIFNSGSMLDERRNSYLLCITISAIGIIVSFINYVILNWKFRKIYKEKVIKKIVNLYNNKFIYDANIPIPRYDYIQSQFNRHFDNFYSEDFIQGEILDNILLKMAQVRITEISEYKDSDGYVRKTETTLFHGLFGIIDIHNTLISKVDIMSNNFLNRFNKNRIEMDSAEFEKCYDIFTKDKVRTMEIFTSDIIDEINKFREDIGHEIQIRIFRGKIFFRIPCGNIFEAPVFKDALDYKTLYKYFRIIDSPISIMTKIVENINQTEK